LNLKRILGLAAALAAVAAAAAVCVVALSFTVYALAEVYLGRAGGAAVVAAVFAVLALVVAWLATRKVVPKPVPGAKPADASLVDRAIGLAKDRPLVALGAAAAAAVVLMRNPAVVGAIVSAFVAGSASKPRK
jgi:uncharacterized membrane protein